MAKKRQEKVQEPIVGIGSKLMIDKQVATVVGFRRLNDKSYGVVINIKGRKDVIPCATVERFAVL